ncbi:MAG: molybdate ABC transporter substrate-binding protein [Proteobacteria bacterium]|nr:molybdate ABC transporter substrate-binding protein [Pseudomonadota bacterium]
MARSGLLFRARRFRRGLSGAFAGLLLAASMGTTGVGAAEPVTMFAAASTGAALEEVARLYEQQGGERVAIVTAATSSLARQIAAGAPADLFLSAFPDWMDFLEERGHTDAATRRALLGNTLVLVAPRGSPLDLDMNLDIEPGFPLAAALGDSRLVMGDPDHVPAGIYGKQALIALGVWPDLSRRVVRTGDVVAALAFVARGEVAAGIVYETDARRSEKVRIVGRFGADTHAPIRYDLALIRERAGAAQSRFYDFLLSPAAGTVFERHGFVFRPGAE